MARPANMTIADLQQMLNGRRADLSKLTKKRNSLQRELDKLDKQIARVGGGGGGPGRRTGSGRARNEHSLTETLALVLKDGKPLSVGEIMTAVEAAGYRSSSDNFRGIINQTLIKERKRFAQASRGVYQLKK